MEVKNGNQHRTPYQRLKFTTCTGHRTNYVGQISVEATIGKMIRKLTCM